MSASIHSTIGQISNVSPAQHAWWAYLLWIPGAALAGFGLAWLLAGRLQLPRSLFLVGYLLIGGAVIAAFFTWSKIDLMGLLRRHWVLGLVGAVVFGAFVVRNVVSQPASTRSEGFTLVFDLLWSGVLYGAIDALLLSVLPVLAVWGAFSSFGWAASLPGKIAVGAIALIASLFVTVCYHLGFPEYRAAGGIFGPVIGNGVMTFGYLLTNNPLTALVSHMAMHISGVLHGPASVMQLPPHY